MFFPAVCWENVEGFHYVYGVWKNKWEGGGAIIEADTDKGQSITQEWQYTSTNRLCLAAPFQRPSTKKNVSDKTTASSTKEQRANHFLRETVAGCMTYHTFITKPRAPTQNRRRRSRGCVTERLREEAALSIEGTATFSTPWHPQILQSLPASTFFFCNFPTDG